LKKKIKLPELGYDQTLGGISRAVTAGSNKHPKYKTDMNEAAGTSSDYADQISAKAIRM
jgi:hypothetical protein